jgi:hypothetical protein
MSDQYKIHGYRWVVLAVFMFICPAGQQVGFKV